MRDLKKYLYPGLVALAVNSFCFLSVMSGGVFLGPLAYVGDWLWYPALHTWMLFGANLKPGYLSVIVLYILGLLQFFAAFWVVLSFLGLLRRKRIRQ